MATLTFLGAARTVTGSKYLIETGAHRVLVDCGLFQGLKELRERNWHDLPVDPRAIDAVVLTHAHLDHCGYLPRIVAAGFRGRIFCTPATAELCRVVLPDAGRLQEEDARQANRHGYTRHAPALPLFREADAFRTLTQLQPLGYERPVMVAPDVEAEFVNAGHLLGSAYARVRLHPSRRVVLFGGDLGRYDRPILPDPRPIAEADVLLVEATYGGRQHEAEDDGEQIAQIVRETVGRGGKVLIPSFAIGRVEEVIYWLRKLEGDGRIPVLPVFVDSPMAVEALGYYKARVAELDPELRPEARDVCAFCTERFRTIATPDESKALVASSAPSIVISSSGMATGGRVLHHLKALLPDARHTVLFVGFQAAGTRGRSLVDGATEVKMHGVWVKVEARIARVESMSAHADSTEIFRWLGGFTTPPEMTYLVHGEPAALEAEEAAIRERLGWRVEIAEYLQRVEVA